MKSRLIALLLLLAAISALILLQRQKAYVPITPRPLLYLIADTEREAERIPLAVTRVSDEQETQVGDQIAVDYGLNSPSQSDSDAAKITNYLNTVGSRVAAHVHRRAIRYHFYLQNDSHFVNAFALPGGHIVVGRGLLQLMESEDELAAVLGHEIAHVDQRHAIEHLQYRLASQKLGLGDVYSLGAPIVDIFKAGYSKELELEADRVGLGFEVAAGYSPMGGVNIMQRFEKLETAYSEHPSSPVGEIAQIPMSALVEYFRSHPPATERHVALEKEIEINGWDTSRRLTPLGIRTILQIESVKKPN